MDDNPVYNRLYRDGVLSTQMAGYEYMIACPKGWEDLVLTLHDKVKALDPSYKMHQVKEKFGGLRYYVTLSSDLDDSVAKEINDLIAKAERTSYDICQHCGDKSSSDWQENSNIYAALCNDCFAALESSS